MENQLQVTNSGLSVQNTVLNEKELEIAKAIYPVSDLRPYQMSDIQLESWSRTINRLLPEVDTNSLSLLIDAFIKGEIEYDVREGIQNIFRGLRKMNNRLVQ